MAPCAMDFELELTQIHNWLDAFVTFRPLLEHVYSKASQQTKNIYWSMVICNNFVQVSKILCNKDGQTKWLFRPSRTTIMDNISHLKSSRIASMWGGVRHFLFTFYLFELYILYTSMGNKGLTLRKNYALAMNFFIIIKNMGH